MFRKLIQYNSRNVVLGHSDKSIFLISNRKLSIVPSIYDKEDPAPKFISEDVQVLLKRLTRPDFAKVFRKRTNSGLTVLRTPKYKFLTSEELEKELAAAKERADELLQMPPVVKIQQPIDEVLTKDPALKGYDTATYLFTDITYGVKNAHRIIVQRDPDGTLRSCDHATRKKLNQIYSPIEGRELKEPAMFAKEDRLHSLLDGKQYEYVLDRACIQYDPDEPAYQRVTSFTYQHVDINSQYEILRSTRHFGPLVFYLAWHHTVDSLMLELIQSGFVREGVLLAAMRHVVKGDVKSGSDAFNLTKQILPTPIMLKKPEQLSEDDIQLDTKCLEYLDQYIGKDSVMKSQHELALQGFREQFQHLVDFSRGLNKMHGNV